MPENTIAFNAYKEQFRREIVPLITDDAFETLKTLTKMAYEYKEFGKAMSESEPVRQFYLRTRKLNSLSEKLFEEAFPNHKFVPVDMETPGSSFQRVLAASSIQKNLPPEQTQKLVNDIFTSKGPDIKAESILALSHKPKAMRPKDATVLLDGAAEMLTNSNIGETTDYAKAACAVAFTYVGKSVPLADKYSDAIFNFLKANNGAESMRVSAPHLLSVLKSQEEYLSKKSVVRDVQKRDRESLDSHIDRITERFASQTTSDYEKIKAGEPLAQRLDDLIVIGQAIGNAYEVSRDLLEHPGRDIGLSQNVTRGPETSLDIRKRSDGRGL
jgi:hypothetical protein